MSNLWIIMMLVPVLLLCPACASPSSSSSSSSNASSASSSARERGKAGEPLRVMSLNVRLGSAQDGANVWPNRRELLVEAIHRFDPDLLGAQEVLEFQAHELREALPRHKFVGVGRDDGKAKGEFSPVFYRADRFELLGSGQFWLSETPEKPGSVSWDSALPRLATWVRLRDRRSAHREMLFINTHWDHAGSVARLRSAELIRKRLADLTTPPAAVILTGDLNCTEDSEPYAVLVGRGDDALTLIDSYRAVHPDRKTDEASFHGFQGTTAGSRIDFIYYTPLLRATEAAIDRAREEERFPSDHYPVTAVLRWAGE